MTRATDLTKKTNSVLASFKGKDRKPQEEEEPDEVVNPVAFETRHGVLVPWGGAMPQRKSDD